MRTIGRRFPIWGWFLSAATLAAAGWVPGVSWGVERAADGKPLVTEAYGVGDVLDAVRLVLGINDQRARESLLAWVQRASRRVETEGPKNARIHLSGEELLVHDTPPAQERIARMLKSLRRDGLQQLHVSLRVLAGPPRVLEAGTASWKLVNVASDDPRPLPTLPRRVERPRNLVTVDETPTTAHAMMRRERHLPVLFGLLETKETDELIAKLLEHDDVEIRHQPQLMVFNGQPASLSTTTQRPFVVGVDNGQPWIRVVSEGFTAELCPLLHVDRQIELDCRFEVSRIMSVESITVERADSNPLTLQVPDVLTTSLSARISLAAERTLLIRGLRTRAADGQEEALLAVIRIHPAKRFERAGAERSASAAQGTIHAESPRDLLSAENHSRIYSVADLISPRPDATEIERDLQAISRLILSTVSPHSWAESGGEGRISVRARGQALVVYQTAENHLRIAEFLDQLRRSKEPLVLLESHVFRLPGTGAEQDAIVRPGRRAQLAASKTTHLLKGVLASGQRGTSAGRWLVLGDGQAARYSAGSRPDSPSTSLFVHTAIHPDGDSVRLTVAVEGGDEVVSPAVIPTGGALLVDLSSPPADREGDPTEARAKADSPQRAAHEASERTVLMIKPHVIGFAAPKRAAEPDLLPTPVEPTDDNLDAPLRDEPRR